MFFSQTKSELKGIIKALTSQKAELDGKKEKLREHERKHKERKLKLKEERKSILEAASRLAWAEKRFEDRIKETEQLAEVIFITCFNKDFYLCI